MDHTKTLSERVAAMRQWLVVGRVPNRTVIHDRLVAEAAKALDGLNIRVVHGVAVVTGSHRLAMEIGYRHAPTIVATNEEFRWRGGPPHRKHTIARWNSQQFVDQVTGLDPWPGMLQALRALEPGWGGSTSICGSPQGVGSVLDTHQVVDMVVRNLIR